MRVDGGPAEALTTFRLDAQVRSREGVQTNDMDVSYRYLAPDCIRFRLQPSGREIGKLPGTDRRAYWLKDKDEIVELVGREHAQDRKSIDEMLSLARNFVALSDPARMRLARLALADGPPPVLPPSLAREARRLDWLEIESPDLALVQETDSPRGRKDAPRPHVARLGVDRESGLPTFVILYPAPEAAADADPDSPDGTGATDGAGPRSAGPLPPSARLIRFADYGESGGYRIPRSLAVHRLDPARFRPAFTDKPAQEIYVREIELQAPLTPADFQP